MFYCYACRNHKPATHSHFVDFGALALRPPKRHISEIEELWDRASEEQRAQALAIGRQILAQEAGQEASAPRSAATPRAPRQRSAASSSPAIEEAQEGEGMGGLVLLGAGVLGILGALAYASWKSGGTAGTGA